MYILFFPVDGEECKQGLTTNQNSDVTTDHITLTVYKGSPRAMTSYLFSFSLSLSHIFSATVYTYPFLKALSFREYTTCLHIVSVL
jgi:hypothetical protein